MKFLYNPDFVQYVCLDNYAPWRATCQIYLCIAICITVYRSSWVKVDIYISLSIVQYVYYICVNCIRIDTQNKLFHVHMISCDKGFLTKLSWWNIIICKRRIPRKANKMAEKTSWYTMFFRFWSFLSKIPTISRWKAEWISTGQRTTDHGKNFFFKTYS